MAIYGNIINESLKTDKISDGNHTFEELYDHRSVLYIVLCKLLKEKGLYIWKSHNNDKGEDQGGYFLLGVGTTNDNPISYHLKNKFESMCDFAEELENAPEFDGYTSNDVLDRLRTIYMNI